MKFEPPANPPKLLNDTTTAFAPNPSHTYPYVILSPTNRSETPPDPPLPVVAERLRQHFAETGEPFASIAEGVILDIAAVLMTRHRFRLGGRS